MKATTFALVFTLAACDLDYVPDVGSLPAIDGALEETDGGVSPAPNAHCSDGDESVTVSFSADILPLLSRSPGACTGCHGAAATSGFTVLTYESLRSGGQVSGTDIVVPGKPCESRLLQKLGPAPPYGARMPYSGPPFFTATDLDLLRDWIAEGARNN